MTRRNVVRALFALPAVGLGLAACQGSGGYMGRTPYRIPPEKSQAELVRERLENERRKRQSPGGRNR